MFMLCHRSDSISECIFNLTISTNTHITNTILFSFRCNCEKYTRLINETIKWNQCGVFSFFSCFAFFVCSAHLSRWSLLTGRCEHSSNNDKNWVFIFIGNPRCHLPWRHGIFARNALSGLINSSVIEVKSTRPLSFFFYRLYFFLSLVFFSIACFFFARKLS